MYFHLIFCFWIIFAICVSCFESALSSVGSCLRLKIAIVVVYEIDSKSFQSKLNIILKTKLNHWIHSTLKVCCKRYLFLSNDLSNEGSKWTAMFSFNLHSKFNMKSRSFVCTMRLTNNPKLSFRADVVVKDFSHLTCTQCTDDGMQKRFVFSKPHFLFHHFFFLLDSNKMEFFICRSTMCISHWKLIFEPFWRIWHKFLYIKHSQSCTIMMMVILHSNELNLLKI